VTFLESEDRIKMSAEKKFSIEILPDGIRYDSPSGISLKQFFEEIKLPVLYPCGGNHSCGKCAVQFLKQPPAPSYEDNLFFTPGEIEQGWRLACTTRISASTTLLIPDELRLNRMIGLKSSVHKHITPQLTLKKYFLHVSPPTLQNLKSDTELILDALEKEFQQHPVISLAVVKKLPALLHNQNRSLTVTVLDQECIQVEEGNTVDRAYGLAVDLGTTTLVVSLHHLPSGQTLGIESTVNPQALFGADLISRLTFVAREPEGLLKLQTTVLQGINNLIAGLCKMQQVQPENIYLMTLAGNAGMNHLFLGIDPQYLALAPYTPVFKELRKEKAMDLQVNILDRAKILVAPNLGGFVGGDVLADMLVAGFGKEEAEIKLLIDIGTNCEVVLEIPGMRLAASSPAGPALEGACISFGMRAEAGAIYDAAWMQEDLVVATIDGDPPRGICGSGLFHLINALLELNVIKPGGKWADQDDVTDPAIKKFFREKMSHIKAESALLVAGTFNSAKRNIYLTQSDIRAFQLAKSAITSAWQVLCRKAAIKPEDIRNVYIAGAFGNFIRPGAAVDLNLVPKIDRDHIHFIGNASLEGARRMLLDQENIWQVERLARQTQFIELAGREDFQELYVENLLLR
jgi:uncharacterized 2Fe-2S/4Fe-4S cluster protein (DUF4445 family)